MQDDLKLNVFSHKGDVIRHFEKHFNITFYYNALNKNGDGKKFTDYLAIILGLDDDES